MKLESLGEFGLIARIAGVFQPGTPVGTIGIGDDCAVLPWTKNERLLVTTDLLVEDIHFLRTAITARQLGAKAMAVNLSDIAAMGGAPRGAFLSLALPRDVPMKWVDAFFDGLHREAAAAGAALLGGDTTRSPGPILVNVALTGAARARRIKYRSSARPGDTIFVTGFLGDSGGGLKILLDPPARTAAERKLLRRHLEPRAALEEGAWLAAQPGVRAMMDVSDGIDSDLHRIMDASACGGDVDFERLPCSPELRDTARRRGWNALELAACGGEDYCLLLTASPRAARRLANTYETRFGQPLHAIGRITATRGRLRYLRQGKPIRLRGKGFNHFALKPIS